nr:unnamed protein product [Callosobruchus analis]
MYKMYF